MDAPTSQKERAESGAESGAEDFSRRGTISSSPLMAYVITEASCQGYYCFHAGCQSQNSLLMHKISNPNLYSRHPI